MLLMMIGVGIELHLLPLTKVRHLFRSTHPVRNAAATNGLPHFDQGHENDDDGEACVVIVADDDDDDDDERRVMGMVFEMAILFYHEGEPRI